MGGVLLCFVPLSNFTESDSTVNRNLICRLGARFVDFPEASVEFSIDVSGGCAVPLLVHNSINRISNLFYISLVEKRCTMRAVSPNGFDNFGGNLRLSGVSQIFGELIGLFCVVWSDGSDAGGERFVRIRLPRRSDHRVFEVDR